MSIGIEMDAAETYGKTNRFFFKHFSKQYIIIFYLIAIFLRINRIEWNFVHKPPNVADEGEKKQKTSRNVHPSEDGTRAVFQNRYYSQSFPLQNAGFQLKFFQNIRVFKVTLTVVNLAWFFFFFSIQFPNR